MGLPTRHHPHLCDDCQQRAITAERETSTKGKKSTPAAKVRADALRMLGCVRIATVRQMAQVITKEDADGRSYVRRAMNKLAELGLAETNGKDVKHQIWNLTPAGQKALADGNELPPRPKAGTGAKAVGAGFGPHGVAVTDMILAYGGRKYLADWQVEVNHAIKETGLSFNIDAVLALPTKTSEVRLFELDNGIMSQARLAKEVWDYERYAGHRVWEGARGTNGRTFPFWQRHRYTAPSASRGCTSSWRGRRSTCSTTASSSPTTCRASPSRCG